eukprot:6205007-Pleurochrysis_carterae.AAC.3
MKQADAASAANQGTSRHWRQTYLQSHGPSKLTRWTAFAARRPVSVRLRVGGRAWPRALA